MPAVSKAQQRWMGMKYAQAKAGHNTTSMTLEQLREYASTSTKRLPMKVGSRKQMLHQIAASRVSRRRSGPAGARGAAARRSGRHPKFKGKR